MTDLNELSKRAASMPQYAQTQTSLNEQLRVVYIAANKLGCYDAADLIRRAFNGQ